MQGNLTAWSARTEFEIPKVANEERIFEEEGQWFFRVRGNSHVGPFQSHHDAQQALRNIIKGYRRAVVQGKQRALWPRAWRPARLLRRSATRQT